MVDLPGVDENNLDINLEKKVLTINGYITPEEPEDFELTYREYQVGDYQRSFTIPDEIDIENIEASISNGVLKIMLHRAPEAQTRKISVKAG
jgi:HSP20 family molecular chaperone IbpA